MAHGCAMLHGICLSLTGGKEVRDITAERRGGRKSFSLAPFIFVVYFRRNFFTSFKGLFGGKEGEEDILRLE